MGIDAFIGDVVVVLVGGSLVSSAQYRRFFLFSHGTWEKLG